MHFKCATRARKCLKQLQELKTPIQKPCEKKKPIEAAARLIILAVLYICTKSSTIHEKRKLGRLSITLFTAVPPLLTTEHCSSSSSASINQLAFNSKNRKKSLLRDTSKQKQIGTWDRCCFADLFALFYFTNSAKYCRSFSFYRGTFL